MDLLGISFSLHPHEWIIIVTHYLLFISLLLSLVAVGYYTYAIAAAHTFFAQENVIDHEFQPSVSILKPVCGCDRYAYENLASFCNQTYSNYQIIFAIHDCDDASVAIVKQLMRDFPAVDLQLVVSDHSIGTNRKVSNVANAFTKARHDIILLADSDVRVTPDYLQQVVQPLHHADVGVVTCLYRSLTEGWLTSFEALSSTTEFHPGVLVSNQLEGVKFTMGQTIVIRRSVLEAIGGFAAIANYLADDFQLGYLPTQAGYKVVLSHQIIEHVMESSTIIGALERQLRWMMGIRVSRPGGYAGLIFTYGTVSSLIFLMATGGALLGWTVLGITWTSRLVMAWFIAIKHLRDPVAQKLFWLVPLRDFVSFVLWCYGFVGNTIKWRDRAFRLTSSGKLVAYIPKLSERAKSVVR